MVAYERFKNRKFQTLSSKSGLVTYESGRLQEVPNNYSDFTWKLLVFWKTGL